MLSEGTMKTWNRNGRRSFLLLMVLVLLLGLVPAASASPSAQATASPKFSQAVAFDKTPPLRELARSRNVNGESRQAKDKVREVRPERGPVPKDRGYSGDGALQQDSQERRPSSAI